MELGKKTISNDSLVRSNTKPGLKDFNSQSLATQAKKGEQLASMRLAKKKLLIQWVMM